MYSISHRNDLLLFSTVAFLSAGAITLIGLNFSPSTEVFLLIFLSILCFLPALVSWMKGKFDVFEPIHYVTIVTFVYFGLIVVVHLFDDSFVMYGINYRDDVPKVIALTILSVLSLYVGYYGIVSPPRSNPSVLENNLFCKDDHKFLHKISIALVIFFSSLVILWVVIGRIPLWTLFVFGQAKYGDWLRYGTGPQIGYLYGARQALPACVLLLIATRSTERWSFWSVLLILVVSIFFAGTGNRSFVLLAMLAAWILYYLERDRRPGIWQMLLLVIIVFYFLIGAVGYYRGNDRVVGTDEFSIDDAGDIFVESTSISVTTAAAVHWIPRYTDYSWGIGFLQIGYTWIPRVIWPDKPVAPKKVFTQDTVPQGATAYWTMWYKNFGPVGIIPGMMMLGWFMRKIYSGYSENRHDIMAQVTLAILCPFVMKIIGRGGESFLFYNTLFVFTPLWLAKWALSRHRLIQTKKKTNHPGVLKKTLFDPLFPTKPS